MSSQVLLCPIPICMTVYPLYLQKHIEIAFFFLNNLSTISEETEIT